MTFFVFQNFVSTGRKFKSFKLEFSQENALG